MTEPVPTPAPQAIGTEPPPLAGSDKPRARRRPALRQVQQCLVVAALAVGCYFLISRFFVQTVRVVGSSMAPTLGEAESYLLNRWVYHVRAPRRSDVVVIRDPSDNGYSVKRIIGVSGDTVCLKDGAVYLNGQLLAEPYLVQGTPTLPGSTKTLTVRCPLGYYYLLGDNRMNSVDSRNYGLVPRANILGLVVN